MSELKPRRPNQICTVFCQSAYHIPCIVPGALSRQDYGAGEEHRNLKMEDWAGDRLPLPAYHFFPFLKLFHKSLRSSFLHSTTQSRLRANGSEHVSPGQRPGDVSEYMFRPARGEGSFALQGAPINSENQRVAPGLSATALSALESKPCKSGFATLDGWPFMRWHLTLEGLRLLSGNDGSVPLRRR